MRPNSTSARMFDRAKLEQLKRTNNSYFDSELANYDILMRQPTPLPSDGRDWEKRSMMLTRARHQALAFLVLMAKLAGAADHVPTDRTQEYSKLFDRVRGSIDHKRLAEIESDLDTMSDE